MSYLEFLNWLLSLGPKLPDILADIQEIVARLQSIRNKLGFGELFAESAAAASAAELAAEQEVIAKAMGGAETFGGPLQNLLDFIRTHQALIKLLLEMFLEKKPA